MCGINGIIDFNGIYTSSVRHDIVHCMNDKIIHRGPDSEGIFDSDHVTMGMRRLSIIDLNTGSQPIYNEDKSVAVVFNGEIYNFIELRNELISAGHVFSTKTDTEVIAHAYEEYGEKAFEKLDGMFAISVYDLRAGTVYLVRDRMGEKPCYYHSSKAAFYYASELKSLMHINEIEKQIDTCALNLYLQLTYIPAPYTIFQNIYKVLPGHYIKINLSGIIQDCSYWELSKQFKVSDNLPYEEAKSQLYNMMDKSVKDRMVSDVPLGAFLSGGIDSSIIVGLMARNSDRPVETFTIGFEQNEYDERERARIAAEFNRTNHHEYVLDFKEALSLLDDILDRMDEPFADSSVLPTYFVSRFAADSVKVVLTGDAGDELFLGYSKYLMGYYGQKYNKIPKFLRKAVIEPIVRLIPDKTVLSRKVRKVIYNSDKDMFTQRLNLMSNGFKTDERHKLLKEELVNNSGLDYIKDTYDLLHQNEELEKTQYTDLKLVLEGDMLAKVDRMSMLNSLETRTPMLAADIVEFAVKLPVKYKLIGKNLKRILKDAFADILPEDFAKLPKSGFAVPLDYWFRTELKTELLEMFSREKLEKQGIFEYSYVNEILEEHFLGKKNRKNEIWTLYVFQKWYDNVLV